MLSLLMVISVMQSYRHFMASLQPPPNTKYTEVSANHVLINCHVNYDIVFVSLADAEVSQRVNPKVRLKFSYIICFSEFYQTLLATVFKSFCELCS